MISQFVIFANFQMIDEYVFFNFFNHIKQIRSENATDSIIDIIQFVGIFLIIDFIRSILFNKNSQYCSNANFKILKNKFLHCMKISFFRTNFFSISKFFMLSQIASIWIFDFNAIIIVDQQRFHHI